MRDTSEYINIYGLRSTYLMHSYVYPLAYLDLSDFDRVDESSILILALFDEFTSKDNVIFDFSNILIIFYFYLFWVDSTSISNHIQHNFLYNRCSDQITIIPIILQLESQTKIEEHFIYSLNDI